jgi:hypothetical protein
MRELIPLLVRFDLSGEWAFDGAPTCAHWVADVLDVETCTAREWLRIGHTLAELDEIAEQFTAGRLSYSKVRVLTRVATPANQKALGEIAERTPAAQLTHAVARWLNRHERPDETQERHRNPWRSGRRSLSNAPMRSWP